LTLQAIKELKAENDELKAEMKTIKELLEKLLAEKKEGDKKLGQLR
jgi:predicted  nucleic acid-binding Zn-ribbon protein